MKVTKTEDRKAFIGGKKEVGISILSCDFLRLADELEKIKNSGISHVHVDVMDTSFTGNISFGPSVVNRILEYDFVFDVHLMLRDPKAIIRTLNTDKIRMLTVHYEIENLCDVIEACRRTGVDVGVAINPETPVECLEGVRCDFVLIMCVDPGFGGQSLKKECATKVAALKNRGLVVGVDGGVNLSTVGLVREADYFIVGTAFFNSNKCNTFVDEFYRKLLNGNSGQGDFRSVTAPF